MYWQSSKSKPIGMGTNFSFNKRFITGQIHLNTLSNEHLIIIKCIIFTNIDTVCQLRNSFLNISGHSKNPFSYLTRIVK